MHCLAAGLGQSTSQCSSQGSDPRVCTLRVSLGAHEQPDRTLPFNCLPGLLLFSPLARNMGFSNLLCHADLRTAHIRGHGSRNEKEKKKVIRVCLDLSGPQIFLLVTKFVCFFFPFMVLGTCRLCFCCDHHHRLARGAGVQRNRKKEKHGRFCLYSLSEALFPASLATTREIFLDPLPHPRAPFPVSGCLEFKLRGQ